MNESWKGITYAADGSEDTGTRERIHTRSLWEAPAGTEFDGTVLIEIQAVRSHMNECEMR